MKVHVVDSSRPWNSRQHVKTTKGADTLKRDVLRRHTVASPHLVSIGLLLL